MVYVRTYSFNTCKTRVGSYQFFRRAKKFDFKILIVLVENDIDTINVINQRDNLEILYQKITVMIVL